MANCGRIGSSTCDGEGNGSFDVGLTGLATLAFLGDGHTTEDGEFRDVTRRAYTGGMRAVPFALVTAILLSAAPAHATKLRIATMAPRASRTRSAQART